MSTLLTSLGVDRLSTPEKLELVQQIWDSIEETPQPPMSHDELLELLRQRQAEHETHPEEAIPWEQVKADTYARWGR